MNREPAQEGFKHYLNMFNEKKILEEDFIKILKNSNEYKRKQSIKDHRKDISTELKNKVWDINNFEKTTNEMEIRTRWKEYKLPEKLNGKTFLDIGCWAGGFCKEAKKRGATNVLGIDMVKSPKIEEFQKEYDFEFLLCDIFSEKFLEIPRFDLVFCAGVLYHVENPISLLFRLKTKTREKLILETEILKNQKEESEPILQFFPKNSLDGNYSNWWVPNVVCVEKMLEACEFENINKMYENAFRICFHASPKNELCKKILPRKIEFM